MTQDATAAGLTQGSTQTGAVDPGATETGADPDGDDAVQASTSVADATGTSDGGTTGGVVFCGLGENVLPVVGDPCEMEGLECVYGDFCAQGVYRCVGGAWDYTTTHGCGAEPVACADEPEHDNGCVGVDTCDPDGDCLDVLECDGSNWVQRDVCNAIACPQASPGYGLPCDDPWWLCPMDSACDVARTFLCGTDGYWSVRPTGVMDGQRYVEPCQDPVPCVAGPFEGDACDSADEVCSYPDPELSPVTCTDGIWT